MVSNRILVRLADTMLDERDLQFGLRWEAVNLLVVDCSRRSRLATLLGSAQTVDPSTLQVEPRIIQQSERGWIRSWEWSWIRRR